MLNAFPDSLVRATGRCQTGGRFQVPSGRRKEFGVPARIANVASENTEQRFLKRATEQTLLGMDRMMVCFRQPCVS